MPRGRKVTNPFPEGSQEHEEESFRQAQVLLDRQADREANPPATERNITVTVSIDAIQAAKSLAVLSGMTYRQVLGEAAREGVETLAAKVRDALAPKKPVEDMPF